MKATEFLKWFHPSRVWVLTSIAPDRRGIETKAFPTGPEQEANAEKWVEKWDGVRNIYFAVAEPIKPEDKKADRENIEAVHWLHVDIDAGPGDLIKELDRIKALVTTRIPEGVPKPTCVVFSGGGYQAFWKLKQPIPIHGNLEAAEGVARYNKALEVQLGGDHCSDVSRIMRLPGTLNIPDAKKKAKGRVPIEAKVVSFTRMEYALYEFDPAGDVLLPSEKALEIEIPGKPERLDSIDDLDRWGVPDRVKVICVQGRDPDNPKTDDDSRSAWLFDACCNLARCGVPHEVVYSVITDPGFKISESVLESNSPHKYALKQIRSATEAVEGDPVVLSDKDPSHSAREYLRRVDPYLFLIAEDWLTFDGIYYPTLEDGVIRSRVHAFLETAVTKNKDGVRFSVSPHGGKERQHARRAGGHRASAQGPVRAPVLAPG